MLNFVSFCGLKMERQFEQALKEKKGFIIKRMGEDGACLFRSVGKFSSILLLTLIIPNIHNATTISGVNFKHFY